MNSDDLDKNILPKELYNNSEVDDNILLSKPNSESIVEEPNV
jgi:hypothetical protein